MCDRNEKKNVVPRWVISISQTFTKHVDHGHGTQTCIEKNSFDKEKIACFKFRIPNNSCNQQQQPKTAQTMKCETCQRFFFRWFIIIIFFFCFAILFFSIHVQTMMMMMVYMVEQIFFRFCQLFEYFQYADCICVAGHSIHGHLIFLSTRNHSTKCRMNVYFAFATKKKTFLVVQNRSHISCCASCFIKSKRTE